MAPTKVEPEYPDENQEAVSTTDAPSRPTDQELEDQKQAELAADREIHNQKTGGGAYPVSDPSKSSAI